MSSLNFAAAEVDIRVTRGATWDHVWTFPHENPITGDFSFTIVTGDGTEIEAECTITDDVAGKVRIALTATQLEFDSLGSTRYTCRQVVGSVVKVWFRGGFATV